MDRITWVAEKVRDLRRRPYGPPIRNTKLKRRAILKNGEYNILPPKFPRRYLYYVRDFFTGLVDAEWKWTLQVMAIGFVSSWIIFSLIWWLIAFVHTDLHDDHLPTRQAETGWTPCVLNIHGWPSCFLYSLETQHTTGYGLRAITEECPEAIFILCAQCIIGMIIDTFTVGVVIAKMTRPRQTNFAVQFSRNAVICMRDGELCMMFRVGDLRKSRLVGVSVGAILIHNRRTKEGETLKYFETALDVECDSTGSDLFFIWPVTVVHKISEDSPFYKLSASDMLQCKFEVILTLDGTVESTGQGTNAKTSYLANEILWGHRFETIVTYNNKLQCYEANYENFEKVVTIQMPMCSAAALGTASDAEDHDQDQDKEDKSGTDTLERNKSSVDLLTSDSQTATIEAKNNTGEIFVDGKQHRQLTPFPETKFPQIPPRQVHLQQSNTSHSPQSQRPITQYFESRKHMFELEEPIQKLQPKMGKSVLNHYEYSHRTHHETIPEEDERSDTPPFPVSWV